MIVVLLAEKNYSDSKFVIYTNMVISVVSIPKHDVGYFEMIVKNSNGQTNLTRCPLRAPICIEKLHQLYLQYFDGRLCPNMVMGGIMTPET